MAGGAVLQTKLEHDEVHKILEACIGGLMVSGAALEPGLSSLGSSTGQ